MQRTPSALAVIAVLVALVACAPEPVDPPSPTAASTTPTPITPSTPSARVVGPGEKPPTIFGGECGEMLTDEQVGDVIGAEPVLYQPESLSSFSTEANAGGLSCTWDAQFGDRTMYLTVATFPAAGLANTELADVYSGWTAPDCDWYCAVAVEVGDVTVVTTVNGVVGDGAALAEVQRMGNVIAGQVVANYATANERWTRDRTGWAAVTDCSTMADPTTVSLGFPVAARDWSMYVDEPLYGGQIADAASEAWACLFTNDAGIEATLWGYAGAAWGGIASEPSSESTAVVGLPEGWTGEVYVSSTSFEAVGVPTQGGTATDGVNVIRVGLNPDAFGTDTQAFLVAAATAFDAQR